MKQKKGKLHNKKKDGPIPPQYLQDELMRGRMLGPFTDLGALPPLQINRFGVIPKGHNTGRWRLITDLSFPQSFSVNDGIDPTLCSMSYVTIDEVANLVTQLGPGALMAKVDIESAYRLIPVHPQDRPLQAMRWDSKVYIDPMLPFGLRSAPKIFNAVADALNWVIAQAGVRTSRHYLDDFIVVGPAGSAECQQALDILTRLCRYLGVPLASHKQVGPTSCLVFLGIEINSVTGQLRLPADKLTRLQTTLHEWGDRKACTRKELESLIGSLNHACKVVRSGRSFLRRMIDLLHAVHRPRQGNTAIRLNAGFRADLAWWQEFLPQWNGVSFLPPPSNLPTIEVTTDASGSWGCGAWWRDSWFQVQWGPEAQPLSIAEKELIPIILACETWGRFWQGRQVRCNCDNQVVIACIRSRTSKAKGLMHLLRCLVFIEAQYHFYIYPVYISSAMNHLADDLSRDEALSFLSKVPSASITPSPISTPLLQALLDPQAEWTSRPWRSRFTGTTRRV